MTDEYIHGYKLASYCLLQLLQLVLQRGPSPQKTTSGAAPKRSPANPIPETGNDED